MNCTCIATVESNIADAIRPKAGDDASAKAANLALIFGDSLECVLQIPFRVKGSKKGYTSEKGKEIGCNVSYCPFCGRSAKHYAVGEDAGIAAAMQGAAS